VQQLASFVQQAASAVQQAGLSDECVVATDGVAKAIAKRPRIAANVKVVMFLMIQYSKIRHVVVASRRTNRTAGQRRRDDSGLNQEYATDKVGIPPVVKERACERAPRGGPPDLDDGERAHGAGVNSGPLRELGSGGHTRDEKAAG
jgi:hypothetical protein